MTTVLYHADCADGFTAAWAFNVAYKNSAEYIPVQHGKPPPDVTGKDVYILDFSYKKETLLKLKEQARSIKVLDHHLSAKNDLEGLDFCIFDMNKSGAGMAWDYLFSTERNWLVNYIEDRDLWKWNFPNAREICEAIDLRDRTFEEWNKLSQMNINDLIIEGSAALKLKNKQIENALKLARPIELDGFSGLAVNSYCFASEIGNKLAEKATFGCVWNMLSDGRIKYSLRSIGNFDVSKIAQIYGGGGHLNASSMITNCYLVE